MVNRHWPGRQKAFNWQLPRAIDMGDTGAIPDLVKVGATAGATMDWKDILGL